MDVKRVASVADRGIVMKIGMHNGGKGRRDACFCVHWMDSFHQAIF